MDWIATNTFFLQKQRDEKKKDTSTFSPPSLISFFASGFILRFAHWLIRLLIQLICSSCTHCVCVIWLFMRQESYIFICIYVSYTNT